MYNQPKRKLIFLVFATCLLGFSPLLLLLGPLFFPVTFFYEKHTWVYYTPSINFLLFGIAIGLLFLACLVILIINKKILMYSLSSILTIAALALIVGGAISYLKITQDGMKFRYPFQIDEQTYKWSDMEKLDYYPLADNEPGRAYYIVTFKDGETYQFKETMDIEMVRSSIKFMLARNDVPYRNMDMVKANETLSEE